MIDHLPSAVRIEHLSILIREFTKVLKCIGSKPDEIALVYSGVCDDLYNESHEGAKPMRVVVLDIETSLSEPYEEKDLEGKPKFPPLPLHVPEVICWLCVDTSKQDMFDMRIHDVGGDTSEVSALNLLANDLQNAQRLITWNGRGFDMPLLGLRALKFGVDWSFWEDRRHRFANYKKALYHYDLQEQLGEYGAARGLSLDRVARLIGLPGKVGIDGSQVSEALEAGKREDVIAYCCNDVFETYLVYLAYANSHLGGGSKAQGVVDKAMDWARNHEYLKRFYK